MTYENDALACCGNGLKPIDCGYRHETYIGDDDGLIAAIGIGEQVTVGDVIDIVATLNDGLNGFDKLGCPLLHGMDVEECHGAWLVVYHVVIGKVNKEIVVWASPLKEGLATFDVTAEGWHGVPLRIVRGHIHAGIKAPAWPWLILGGIAGAVEEYVVDARDEHEIEVRLALRKRGAEVLCEPGEGLARDMFFP